MNNKKTKQNNHGATVLIFVIFFVAISLSFVLTIGKGIYDDYAIYQALIQGKKSFLAAESGIDDAVYRLRDGRAYSDSYAFSFGGINVDMTHSVDGGAHVFLAEGDSNNAIQKSEARLILGDGVSFGYGLHSGVGGIKLENSSSIVGNIYANGPVEGADNWVYGDVISAGASGLVEDINATGTVRSNHIEDADIDKHAYYQTITSTLVNGSTCTSNPYCHPGSPNEPMQPFAISDETINEWKTHIETSGTIIASTDPECSSGTYEINIDTTLGLTKIDCNVQMKKQGASTEIILEEPIWITGNLTFDSGPDIVASSSVGTGEVPIIVDGEDTAAPYDSDLVTVGSGTIFSSATTTSYILLVAMNKSAEEGGSEVAIDLGQTTSGRFIAYAPHGHIEIGQSTSLKAVTAYQIRVFNSAQVIYEDGLKDSHFSGTGGGYTIVSWEEVE